MTHNDSHACYIQTASQLHKLQFTRSIKPPVKAAQHRRRLLQGVEVSKDVPKTQEVLLVQVLVQAVSSDPVAFLQLQRQVDLAEVLKSK